MLYETDLELRHWGALTRTRQLVNKAPRPQDGLSAHDDERWLFYNNAVSISWALKRGQLSAVLTGKSRSIGPRRQQVRAGERGRG